MKSIWKRIITITLVFLLLINTCMVSDNDVFAAENGSDTSISTSNYGAANVTLTVKNDSLVFEDLPDEPGFQKMILVSLYTDKTEETIGKKQLTVSTNTTYSLTDVENGIYYVQLYYLDSSGSKFKSYWLKKNGVKIKKNGNKTVILKPETYQSNLDIYYKHAESDKALEFYLQPDLYVDSDNSSIKKKALEITAGITDDYEKVKAVHNWVAENIWYDYDGLNGKSEIVYRSSEVLKTKRSVCQGFADLAAAMLRSLGIPTKVTNGYAMGVGTSEIWSEDILKAKESNHAWNESYVNGRWIIYDCTWDSDNKYINGKFSSGTGCTGYCYFDLTIDRLSCTHYITDQEEKFLKGMAKELEAVTCREYVAGRKGAIWAGEHTVSEFEYQFESANENIAVVDKYGVVTGVAEGRVNLTVTLTFNGEKVSYQLPIIVMEGNGEIGDEEVEAPIADKPQTASFDEQSSIETKGKQTQEQTNPKVDVNEENQTQEKLNPKSDVTDENQPQAQNEQTDVQKMLQEIYPSVNEVNLVYGGNKNNSTQLKYYCDKEILGKFKITYWVEDSSIARVSSDGIITAKGVGETTLHITYQADNYKVNDAVDIYVKAAKIKISAGNKKIKKGKSKTLTAKAANISGTIKWSTSNKKIATISGKGKVSGKKKGKVTITASIGKVKSKVKLTIY